MVKELIDAGFEGDKLLAQVIELTGLPAPQAAELIAVETGESDGDIGPVDAPMPTLRPFELR